MGKIPLPLLAMTLLLAGASPFTRTGFLEEAQNRLRKGQEAVCRRRARLDIRGEPKAYRRESTRLDRLESRLRETRDLLYGLRTARRDWREYPPRIDARLNVIERDLKRMDGSRARQRR